MDRKIIVQSLAEIADAVRLNDVQVFARVLDTLNREQARGIAEVGPLRASVVVALDQASRRALPNETRRGIMCPLHERPPFVEGADIEYHLERHANYGERTQFKGV